MIGLTNEGMAIAPGVVETIVSLAVKEVPGVENVGNPPADLLRAVLHGSGNNQGVEIVLDEAENLAIAVHVTLRYGAAIPPTAAAIRSAAADAVESQVGLHVSSVDVFVENLRFGD